MPLVFLTILVIYQFIELKIFNRTKKMEEVLPEFLRYVSQNLKGGMSFEKALWTAIRPRFGILADEIQLVAKRVMSGLDIEVALKEFTEKYDSPMLKRTFNLVIEGMKGGVEIAELIDRIDENIRETQILKQEMSATNTTYVIFMSIIVMFVAPGLFGLSFNLLLVLTGIMGSLGGPQSEAANLPINLGDIEVDPSGFKVFSIIALIVTSVFASMIISIIRRGNIKQGIKYIPIFSIVSVVVYFVVRTLLSGLFTGMIG